jgi:hypothetical protein
MKLTLLVALAIALLGGSAPSRAQGPARAARVVQ